MNSKNTRTLMCLMDIDDSSRENLERLFKSKFPDDFISCIISAKQYWGCIRVETLSPFAKGKISLLLKTVDEKKLDEATKLCWSSKNVILKHIDRVEGYHDQKLHHDFLMDVLEGTDYIQHDYIWDFS